VIDSEQLEVLLGLRQQASLDLDPPRRDLAAGDPTLVRPDRAPVSSGAN
jgi:hypothetical protein